jgi:heat shock protein HslJ
MKVVSYTLSILTVIVLAFLGAALTAAQETPDLAGTRWELAGYGDPQSLTPVVTDRPVTLEFIDGERLGGSGGCNGYGSSYTLNGDALTVEAVVSTMMACMTDGLMEQEQAYFAALQSATRYAVVDGMLIIEYGEEGQHMAFMPARNLTDGSWQLIAFVQDGEQTPVIEGTLITAMFDAEGRIGGSGGCNSYGGSFSAAEGGLTFSGLFSTERACLEEGVMAQERAYFDALQAATRYSIIRNALVIATGDGGQLIFTFVPGLTDTAWQLESWISGGEASAPVADSLITLEFSTDGRVAGTGGCNRYGGTFTAGDEGTLTVSALFSTRRACMGDGLMQQEQAYLAALETATAYAISGAQLTITYGDGDALVFIPAATVTAAR